MSYAIRTEKSEPIKNNNFKSFDYLDRPNYDLVMLYLDEKLFSKVQHIKISALCVYFKGFIAKKLTRNRR